MAAFIYVSNKVERPKVYVPPLDRGPREIVVSCTELPSEGPREITVNVVEVIE